MKKFNLLLVLAIVCFFSIATVIKAQEPNDPVMLAQAATETEDLATIIGVTPVTAEDDEDQVCFEDTCIDSEDIAKIASWPGFQWVGIFFKWLLIIGAPILITARFVAGKVKDTYTIKSIPIGAIAHWIKDKIKITRKKKK